MSGFKTLQLNKPIQRALADKHYFTPTPVQAQVIPLILEGKDVIVTARTGTGKTAAFALPIIQKLYDKQIASRKGRKIRALIVSPTRELAIQIEENFKSYHKYSQLESTVVYGGTSIESQTNRLKSGVDILIATPGRLLDLHKQNIIKLDHVENLVLDEADLMLDMGFIDDIFKISKLCTGRTQTLLFSATMPNNVIELSKTLLDAPCNVQIDNRDLTNNPIEQKLFYVPVSKKNQLCVHLLKQIKADQVIIFRRTKYGVEKLENVLIESGFEVVSIHGGKSQALRKEALNTFKNSGAQILIATDLAARGIDVNELSLVINFDIPNVPETYIHRIGRTGRAGNPGLAYSLCSAEDKAYINDILNLTGGNIVTENDHPFPLDPDAQPTIHKKKGSKYRKGRKSKASKQKKKRWY